MKFIRRSARNSDGVPPGAAFFLSSAGTEALLTRRRPKRQLFFPAIPKKAPETVAKQPPSRKPRHARGLRELFSPPH